MGERRGWRWTAILAVAMGVAWMGAPFLASLWRAKRLRRAPRPLDVVLLTLDTTRADRLKVYGGTGKATPHLDALASRGVVFRQAYAHAPLTAVSHASILTGLTPAHHGVHDNGNFVLGRAMPTLAERFVEAGYRTGAFVSAFVLDRRFGLARGFATYDDEMQGTSLGEDRPQLRSVPAALTIDRALAWLGQDDRRPVFAWVHLYDPHAPYEPPEPYATRFRDNLYDGEVAFMDAEVGRLLAEVARRGERGRPALLAVVGDHGEALGEHVEAAHGYFIYGATQRVPFLLALPGVLPSGLEVAPVVRGIDVMPTVLEIAGLPAAPDLDGRSLLPLVVGAGGTEPGPAYLESYQPRLWWGAQELVGLRTERWLFVESPTVELYDTEQDGGETRNVAAGHPAEVDRLRARLRPMTAPGDALASRSEVDADTAERLRGLGYQGAGVALAPAAGGALPDAKENGPLLAGAHRGLELAEHGRLDEALAVYRETLGLNPRSTSLQVRIAETLYELKRYDEAYAAFEALARGPIPNEHYPRALALCRMAQGRPADALAHVRHGLATSPDSPRLREQAGEILLALGRAREAETELREAIRRGPAQLSSHLLLATSLERQGRLRDSAAALKEIVDRSPRSAEARAAAPRLAGLAELELVRGSVEDALTWYRAAMSAGMSDEATYLNLALACHRLGRVEESLDVVRRGAAQNPRSFALRYRLGRLLEERGRKSEAAAAYRQAIELDGTRAEARQALARLENGP